MRLPYLEYGNSTAMNIRVVASFLISFCLILCLPVICFSFIFLQNYRKIYCDKIVEQAQISLESAGRELERTLDNLFNIVIYNELKADFSMQDSDVVYRNSELAEVLKKNW